VYKVKIRIEVYDNRNRLVEEIIKVIERIREESDIDVATRWLGDRLRAISGVHVPGGYEKVQRKGMNNHILQVLKENAGKYLTSLEIADLIKQKFGYRPRPQAVALLLMRMVKEGKYRIDMRKRNAKMEWKLIT